MLKRNSGSHVLILLVILGVITAAAQNKVPGPGTKPPALAAAGSKANLSAAKEAYEAQCAQCHGTDGRASGIGKTLGAPDLRSAKVQKVTGTKLKEEITNGVGNMPPFKGALTPDEITALVKYIRSLTATTKSSQTAQATVN